MSNFFQNILQVEYLSQVAPRPICFASFHVRYFLQVLAIISNPHD